MSSASGPQHPIGSSGLVLIVANLVPLFGILFLDWDVLALMLQFWFENVFIGIFSLIRIATARKDRTAETRFVLPLFFLLHYGLFTLGHGFLLLDLFGGGGYSMEQLVRPAFWFHLASENGILIALAALFVSHLYSFVDNYVLRQEYRNLDARKAMTLPYPRVAILHVSLLFGGMILKEFGQPAAGLVIFVVLKVALDLSLHRREHRRLQAPGQG
jgi:hypothetical protein